MIQKRNGLEGNKSREGCWEKWREWTERGAGCMPVTGESTKELDLLGRGERSERGVGKDKVEKRGETDIWKTKGK